LVYNCRCTIAYLPPHRHGDYSVAAHRLPEYDKYNEWKRNQLAGNNVQPVQQQAQVEQPTAEVQQEQPRWRTREEYEEARQNREQVFKQEREQAEQWYSDECDRILDEKYDGGDFTSQRIAVKHDDSLSDEEKERRLDEIEEKRHKFQSERNEIAHRRDELIADASRRKEETFDPDYEYEKISGNPSVTEQASAVNPHYLDGVGYTVNCQSCGFAFELRMRGYDVEATEASYLRGAGAESHIIYAFGKSELSMNGSGHSNTIAVRDKMYEWGDGSRAIVSIERNGNTAGHIFNVAVVDGHFTVIDSQTGLVWNDADNGSDINGMALEEFGTVGFSLYRTDNKPIKYVPETWVQRKQNEE